MKRRIGRILCGLLVFQVLLAACEKKETNTIVKPEGAEELVKDPSGLRERFPQYFDLSTFKGLEVYVWSMAEGSYSCGVLPGTNRNKTHEEIWELGLHSVSARDMKEILAAYDIPDEEVFLFACFQPISSYAYTIDEDYCKAVSALFDDRYPCFRFTEYME